MKTGVLVTYELFLVLELAGSIVDPTFLALDETLLHFLDFFSPVIPPFMQLSIPSKVLPPEKSDKYTILFGPLQIAFLNLSFFLFSALNFYLNAALEEDSTFACTLVCC